ncbi:MAG: hypothetical protein ABIG95_02680 [Candidatus Woesearchaeota archaeon]
MTRIMTRIMFLILVLALVFLVSCDTEPKTGFTFIGENAMGTLIVVPNVKYAGVTCGNYSYMEDCDCKFEVENRNKSRATFRGSGNTPQEACSQAIDNYQKFCEKTI